MIGLGGVGWYMVRYEAWSLYPWHKSLGLLALLLACTRAIIRLREGWPSADPRHPAWERRLARLSHWGLLVFTLALPVSGALYSYASGHELAVFKLTLVPSQYDGSGGVTPRLPQLEPVAQGLHRYLGWCLAALLTLHVAGALKHHWVDRDNTLLRMLTK